MRARRNRRTGLTPVLVRVGVLALIAAGGCLFWKLRNRPPTAETTTAPIPPKPSQARVRDDTTDLGPGGEGSASDYTPPAQHASEASQASRSEADDEPATIKGNASSMLYHTTASPSYKRMKSEILFRTEDEARAAGYRRWDHKRTSGGSGG